VKDPTMEFLMGQDTPASDPTMDFLTSDPQNPDPTMGFLEAPEEPKDPDPTMQFLTTPSRPGASGSWEDPASGSWEGPLPGEGTTLDQPMPARSLLDIGKDAVSDFIGGGREAARGAALGAGVDTPEMFLRAGRVMGINDKLGIDTDKWLGKTGAVEEWLRPENEEAFKTLRGSFRMVPASVAGGLPGAAVGAGLGSLGSPIGTALGAVMGYAGSAGFLFGIAEYDSFMEEAEKLGISREKARTPAILSGLAEGGFEAVSDLALGKILGLSKPLKEGALTPLRKHLANMAKSIPVETLSEMATAAAQDEAAKSAGMPHQGKVKAALEVAPVAAGGAALMGGMGSGVQAYRERAVKKQLDLEKEKKAKDDKKVAHKDEKLRQELGITEPGTVPLDLGDKDKTLPPATTTPKGEPEKGKKMAQPVPLEERLKAASEEFSEEVGLPEGMDTLDVGMNADKDALELHTITVETGMREKGIGGRALRRLTEIADKHGLAVEVEPGGGEESAPMDIVAWYSRHGFEWQDGFMRREPDLDSSGMKKPGKKMAQPVPGMYSQFSEVAEKKLPGKMFAKQASQQIDSMVKKGEVKAEEVESLGIKEWLAEQGDRKVSKQEVMEYVRGNQLELEETTRGHDPGKVPSDEEQLERHGIPETEIPNGAVGYKFGDPTEPPRWIYDSDEGLELEREGARVLFLGEILTDEDIATKFNRSDLNLPGGENYREILLRMPHQPLQTELPPGYMFTRLDDGAWGVVKEGEGGVLTDSMDKQQAAQEAWLELGLKYPAPPTEGTFTGGHWDEPNVLAHIRANDRTDADGKKVLFLEEIQSDWHQAGKRGGYKPDEETSKKLLDAAKDNFETVARPVWDKLGLSAIEWEQATDSRVMNVIGDHYYRYKKEPFPSEVREAYEKIIDAAEGKHGTVPDAPFKKTWPMLAMKRMIREAAENGYDRIAWTTGAQQAERYDLSKQVEKIVWGQRKDQADRGITIMLRDSGQLGGPRNTTSMFVDKEGKVVDASEKTLNGKMLDEVVGKEIADKLMAAPGEYGTLEGLDLKVGGEGMKRFYDDQLVRSVNKYVKKWGAKVGKGEFGERFTTHSLDITPDMKAAVLGKGQPMFQPTKWISISDRPDVLLEDLKRIMPWGTVEQTGAGKFRVTMPNGMKLTVSKQLEIVPDEEVLESIARERGAKNADQVRAGAMRIAGAFQRLSAGEGMIELSKYERDDTLDHEIFHAAMRMVLTPAEIRTILKKYGNEEMAADAYANWNPRGEANSLFRKIYNFFRQFVRKAAPNLFPANAKEIFQAIERGDVWQDKSEGPRASIPPKGRDRGSRDSSRFAAFKSRLRENGPWSQGKNLQLVKREATVRKRVNTDEETRIYEVSVPVGRLARVDNPVKRIIKTLSQARKEQTGKERVEDYGVLYERAPEIKTSSNMFELHTDGKLKDLWVLHLTRGCQRAHTSVERVATGVLPMETRIEACYGGICWVNRQFNHLFGNHLAMELRDLEFINVERLHKWLTAKNSANLKRFNESMIIRCGQKGCDSHAIANGTVLEWLKLAKDLKVKPKTILISGAYAPITDAQYKALAPYADQFELHISNSGWFHKNEVMIRLAEFDAARSAGLNTSIRIITNADNIADVKMINEQFLISEMKKAGVTQGQILETPFHEDVWKNKKDVQDRSEPSGKFENICCEGELVPGEGGVCRACGPKCMANVDASKGATVNYQLVDEPTAGLKAQPAQPVIKGKKEIVFAPRRGSIKRSLPSEMLPEEGKESRATRKEITNEIMEAFGIPILFGRVSGGVAGKMWERSGFARVKRPLDIEGTLLTVAPRAYKLLDINPEGYAKELQGLLADPEGVKNPTMEGAAQFFQRYVTGVQSELVKDAPQFHEAFEGALFNHPELQEAMVRIRQMWVDHQLLPPQKKLETMIVSGDRKKPRMSMNEFWAKFINDIEFLDVFSKEVEKRMGDKLETADNPHKVAWLTRGWPKRAIQFLRWGTYRMTDEGFEAQGPGLFPILKGIEAEGRRQELDQYLVAKRVVNDDRLLESYENIMSREEFQQVVDQLEPELEQVAGQLHKYNADLLQFLVDSGRISQELAEKIQEKNLFYVPLYRVMDSGAHQGGLSNRKFGDIFSPLKKVGGEAREVYSPTETMVANTFTIINLASRNEVGKAMAKIAELPNMGDLIHKVDTPMKPQSMKLEEALKSIQKQLKDSPSDVAARILEVLDMMTEHNKVVNKIFKEMEAGEGGLVEWENMVEEAGLAPEDVFLIQEVLTAFRPNYATRENEAIFYENGEPTIYWMAPEVHGAIMGLDAESVNAAWRLFAHPAKWLRAGATIYSPEFALRNPVRDQITAFLFTNYGYKPFWDLGRGIFHILGKTELYQQFNASGAGTSALVSMDRNYIQTDLSKILANRVKRIKHRVVHPLESVQMLSEILEEGTRVGAMARAAHGGVLWGKKEGTPDRGALMDAGIEARDMTLDFKQFGQLTKGYAMISAFWNPKIQGLEKMRRQFRDHPARTTALGFFGITLPSLLIWYAQKDDEFYQEIAPWRRILFWNFVTHNDDGSLKNIWSIPKPFEMGLIFGSIPEIIGDWIVEHDKATVKELGKALWEGASPFQLPNVAIAPIEWKTEQSLFFDRPTVPRDKLGADPYLQYGPYTSRSIRLLAEAMNKVPGLKHLASPGKLENLLYTTFAGAGRLVVASLDRALEKFNVGDIPDMPAQDIHDVIPGWKGFHTRFPSASSRSVGRFYDELSAEMQKHKSTKITEGIADVAPLARVAGAGGLVNEISGMAKSGRLRELEKYKDLIDIQRNTAREIFANKTATPEEKKKALDACWWAIIDLAREAIGKEKLTKRPIGWRK